jgi:hypothetical protein
LNSTLSTAAPTHEAEGGVPACTVRRGGEHTGVQESVLLREIVAHIELDVDLTGGDARKTRTDRRHESLTREAVPNARVELRILRRLRLGRRHAACRHAQQIGSAPKSTSRRRSHEPCR